MLRGTSGPFGSGAAGGHRHPQMLGGQKECKWPWHFDGHQIQVWHSVLHIYTPCLLLSALNSFAHKPALCPHPRPQSPCERSLEPPVCGSKALSLVSCQDCRGFLAEVSFSLRHSRPCTGVWQPCLSLASNDLRLNVMEAQKSHTQTSAQRLLGSELEGLSVVGVELG